ncbi:MAG: hypothetical protein WC505_00420 [Patescibacteria group bacterium]
MRQSLLNGTWTAIRPPDGADAGEQLEKVRTFALAFRANHGGISVHQPPEEWCNFCIPNCGAVNPDIMNRDGIRVTTLRGLSFLVTQTLIREGVRGLYNIKSPFGVRERVLFPDHGSTLPEIPPAVFAAALRICRERILSLKHIHDQSDIIMLPELIIGIGGNSVVSERGLSHTHVQIVGVSHVSIALRLEMPQLYRFYMQHERCPVCDIIRIEREGTLTVGSTEHFLALVPYASQSPFTICITPLDHYSQYEATPPELFGELGALIQDSVAKLGALLGDRFPYYLILRNGPERFTLDAGFLSQPLSRSMIESMYHYSITIVPQFPELPSEIEEFIQTSINPVPPEFAAQILKQPPDQIRQWVEQ